MTIEDQPPPSQSDRRPIWELVIEDMQERDRVGRERYGTPLQAFNGRDMMIDLYQELLDAVCYVRGWIEEERIREQGGEHGTITTEGEGTAQSSEPEGSLPKQDEPDGGASLATPVAS